MRPVIFQEPDPARARTYSSTAEAFRELPYCTAIQRWPAPRRFWRIVDTVCWIFVVVLIAAPFWYRR
jgi:hypothetical protein